MCTIRDYLYICTYAMLFYVYTCIIYNWLQKFRFLFLYTSWSIFMLAGSAFPIRLLSSLVGAQTDMAVHMLQCLLFICVHWKDITLHMSSLQATWEKQFATNRILVFWIYLLCCNVFILLYTSLLIHIKYV